MVQPSVLHDALGVSSKLQLPKDIVIFFELKGSRLGTFEAPKDRAIELGGPFHDGSGVGLLGRHVVLHKCAQKREGYVRRE